MARQCGTCTKCCDGTLSGSINGHEMGFGKPCYYLTIGKGCNIYENRPQEPCKRYECAWISDENIPDFMKPENSNCILDYKEENKIKYLRLTESTIPYTAEVLSWCINYAKLNNLNFAWSINKKSYYIKNNNSIN
jgi:hypothetical protein